MPKRWSNLGRWNQALVLLAGAYLALWPLESSADWVYTARVVLQTLLYALGSLVLIRLLYRLARLLMRRFLWRVRHRMLLAYFFVGVVPLALAVLLSAMVGVLLFMPVAAYLVRAEIEERAAALYATADSVAWELRASEDARKRDIGRRFLQDARKRYPGLEARLETEDGPITYPEGALQGAMPIALENFRGVVRRDDAYFLSAYARFEPGSPSLLVMAPITRQYLRNLLPGLGRVEILEVGAGDTRRFRLAATPEDPRSADPEGLPPPPAEALLPPPAHPLDWPLWWTAPTPVLDWSSGEQSLVNLFALQSRPSAVVRLILAQQSAELNRIFRGAGILLLILFAAALIVSTIVAVSLTRTATSAIHDLYVGTRHVDRGDFSHRVPQRGYSQLTELARSFNSMTGSIEKLIEDSKERERLESELAIAQEVQAQLFPREAPRVGSLEVLGVCRPARAVSGDFYDYVQLSDRRLALSFGDVAGKGISAALVMAAVHSTLRTQLALLGGDAAEADLAEASARLVSETNRQLCAGTAPDKFATLFFGAYDERRSALAYVNAGHLPPLLIRGGRAQPLEVTGMVVGAFLVAEYEASVVELESNDLLVAFTDGLTEPENPYGEQFGEQRLAEAVLRAADLPIDELIRSVMAEVDDWAGAAPEQQDDMTILVVRRTA